MQLVGRGGWLHSGEAPITLPVPPPKKSGQQSTIPAVVTVGKQAQPTSRMAAVWLGGYFCTTVCVIKPKPLPLLGQSSGAVIIVLSLYSPVTPVDPGLH